MFTPCRGPSSPHRDRSEGGEPISAGQARRLACTHGIIPAIHQKVVTAACLAAGVRSTKLASMKAAEVRAIMATQLTRADRLARADDVIDNSGPPGALAGAVARLDASYRALAAARRDARP